MKKILLIAAIATAMASCKKEPEFASFGEKINTDDALTKQEMLDKYKSLKPGDTLTVKFKSDVQDVCSKKGCWMAMDLPGDKESFVRFKDYGFFVPLNSKTHQAVVQGKAYIDEVSVDQLRHYAKDGGKSEEEIAAITEPEVTYAFMANGVLMSK